MDALLQTLHWLAGLVVLAEALNKLERTSPFAPGIDAHKRLVDSLKALAWVLLAIGAADAVVMPMFGDTWERAHFPAIFQHEPPSLADAAVLLGFAVLIVRTRVKEG